MANSQAESTAKHGLTNSEGCSENHGSSIQRRAPLISAPMNSVVTISATATAKPAMAMRRTLRGVWRETANITASATGSTAK